MKKKANRLDAIKMIISSKEVGSQEELLQELNREGFELTQATLSRDLKQLKVAKAASMNGKYVYVLPNNIMYKRSTDQSAGEMLRNNGFISLQFSGNIAVIRTRPGYASSMAYDIFSFLIDVISPCPGYTCTASGRTNNFSRIDRTISDILPPGKSVLPTDSWKSVSPEKSIPAFGK